MLVYDPLMSKLCKVQVFRTYGEAIKNPPEVIILDPKRFMKEPEAILFMALKRARIQQDYEEKLENLEKERNKWEKRLSIKCPWKFILGSADIFGRFLSGILASRKNSKSGKSIK